MEGISWPTDMGEVEVPTVQQLRAVAHTFPARAALGCDVVHPRHFAMLSDELLGAMITLWAAMLALGRVPSVLAMMLIALIPKADGGLRPIGLFPGSLKPMLHWTKSGLGSKWATAHRRPYFFGEQGKSCDACVWIQAAAADFATERQQAAVSVLFDLKKAYEHMRYDVLRRAAEKHDFPLLLMRLLLSFCSMMRVLSLGNLVAFGCMPMRGVVAGCSFADIMMRLCLIDPLDRVTEAWPSLRLADVVDDAQMLGIGDARRVVPIVKGAIRRFQQEVRGVSLVLNEGKTALVSNDLEAARRLTKEVPTLRNAHARSVRNLGVDYACGRRAGASTRAARLKKVRLRAIKIKWLRKAGGRSASLVKLGLTQAGVWGLNVGGALWSHIARLRAAAHASLGRGHGRSATVDLALTRSGLAGNNPAVISTTGSIHMLHRALWEGWLDRGMLYRLIGPAYKRMEHAARPWEQVRGPVSAAVACCLWMGWRFVEEAPNRIVMRTGHELGLASDCPRTLQALAKRDAEAWLLCRAAGRQGYMGDLTHQPFLRPLQQLCCGETSEGWTWKHQGILRALAANGMWCQHRLHASGLADSAACLD